MTQTSRPSTAILWARFRFSVVGSLLAAPPARGELKRAIESLAAKTPRFSGQDDSQEPRAARPQFGIRRLSHGPSRLASGTGIRRQMLTRKACLSGFKEASLSGSPWSSYERQMSGSARAFHCFLKWNVPVPTEERPKSNSSAPPSRASRRIPQ